MTPSLPDLLRALDEAGASLARKGQDLAVYRASPELIPACREHKPALLALLAERCPLTVTAARVRLTELALIKDLPLALVTLLDRTSLAGCVGLSDCQLMSYLLMLRDSTERLAGRVPPEDTSVIRCHHCGPVFAHPSIAARLPIIRGLPHALGCPWCHVRAKGVVIPHPEVSP